MAEKQDTAATDPRAPHPAFAPGNVAVITGASSGIGLAMATRCNGLGMTTVLVDVAEERLRAAVRQLPDPTKGKAIVCNVSDASAVAKMRDSVLAEFGKVHVLHANAGIGNGRQGALAPVEKWVQTMGTNFFGVLHTCNAFIPGMQSHGEPGLIVNTGSKQGITFPPGNLAYNVSKAAVKCYTEGLEHELRNVEGNQISAYLLVPGWTNSLMTNPKGNPKADGAWTPEQVIEYLFVKIAEKIFYVICPDNETTEDVDNKKMLWEGSQVAERRPPLSRWHRDYKEKFNNFMLTPSE